MITFLQATFEGLSLGAVYSLVAIGFVLIYKATDVLSFAQPALVVVGAGLISALAVDRGVPFWIAFIVGILLTGIIGLVMERTFLRPMVGEPVFSVAILTIGIDILLRTVLNNWIGLNPRYLGDPFQSFGNFGSVNVGGVTLKYLEIAALFTGVVLIILLSVFFKRSKYGVAMMATSYDQEAALAQGINVGRIFGLVWLISGVLAGFAGFFITGGFNTLTQASFLSALRVLPAVAIGGLDSIPGAVIGSLIIGLTQGYVAYYQLMLEGVIGFSLGSGFSLIAPYLIMFFILIFRPDGLFGTKEVERV
ncbi:branched-chain amino acid ABC transporter permease [Acidimicrobiaceae bacterium]|jgi:branched-chain amino acid transport system permease protein|nr:branched-chain amino acid ABC transporter permease [Acidimicrobiaceae bacterium]MDA9713280.1 branched-chain amino acid ABC transporter permease [Acidimicrobiaceae bacterium]|tara:strand:- start:527 stop:1447 length:921 start_codon:yes stop_codon:yes gene_type:complete